MFWEWPLALFASSKKVLLQILNKNADNNISTYMYMIYDILYISFNWNVWGVATRSICCWQKGFAANIDRILNYIFVSSLSEISNIYATGMLGEWPLVVFASSKKVLLQSL